MEATSGNTGIALALACAVKGYRMESFMPRRMTKEKEMIMKSLGCKVNRTPDVGWTDPQFYIT